MIAYLEIIERGVDPWEIEGIVRIQVGTKEEAVALYPSYLNEFTGIPWEAIYHEHNHSGDVSQTRPCVIEVLDHV